MCLGGEYAAAMVLMVESAPTHRRGFYGSWSDVGLQIGVLGSTNSLLLLYCFFSESEIYDFAWRISFILSAILIPFAIHFYGGKEGASSSLLLSEILAEMPVEEKEKRPKKTRKIIEGLRESRQAVFCTIAVTAFSAVAFYTLFVFLPYYLEQEKILTLKESTMCSALASLSVIIAALGCGYLSDHFRRKPFIICGIIGVSAVVYTIFLLKISTLFAWIIAYICYGIFLGMYFSSRSAFFSESFPKKIRCTGVSLSISLAQAIGGGMTPIIMKFCVSASVMMSIVPATIVGIVSLAAMWKAQDRTGMELL
jgi:MFS family permease